MIDVKNKQSLSAYTSWKVGGEAERLFQPKNVEDLSAFLKQLPEDEPITWLGLGSNVLVRDGGIQGTVIVTFPALNNMKLNESLLAVQAGAACAQVARFTARHGLKGLEFLAGIPGTVGGALAMNAGCHGGQTWDAVQRVEMINRRGERFYRHRGEFTVAYRQVTIPENEWFLSAEFVLAPGDKAQSLQMIRDLLDRRARTQPTHLPSCGSVFCNPPHDYAARLIEASGLKGFSIGGAQISEKHANFIVNTGKATATEIERLIEHIEQLVLQRFGITLQREVKIIGQHLRRQ